MEDIIYELFINRLQGTNYKNVSIACRYSYFQKLHKYEYINKNTALTYMYSIQNELLEAIQEYEIKYCSQIEQSINIDQVKNRIKESKTSLELSKAIKFGLDYTNEIAN